MGRSDIEFQASEQLCMSHVSFVLVLLAKVVKMCLLKAQCTERYI